MRLNEVIDQYHIWDARHLDELLPHRQFLDVTITSPPYWNLKDYGYGAQIGFGQSYDQYLSDLEDVFRVVFARTKKTGSLWIISDTFKQNGELQLLPFDISARLQKVGWMLQDIVIWQKDRTLPWSHQGKLRNIFEYVAFYTKNKRFQYHVSRIRNVTDLKDYWVRYPERYNPNGKAPVRTWDFPIPRQGSWGKLNNYVRHACPLPPGLIERIISLTSNRNDIIFDPFAGSGSVLATASALERRFIGTDLSRKYRHMFRTKVLPAVVSQCQEIAAEAKRTNLVKKRFLRIIRTLRVLKYPKELIRLLNAQTQPHGCLAAVIFYNRRSRKLYLVLVFSSQKAKAAFLRHASELSSRPPLSKYGLRPIIAAVTYGEFSLRTLAPRGLERSHKLYVYTSGRFYAWSETIPATEMRRLMAENKKQLSTADSYPPVFSNLSVNVDPTCPQLFQE